MSYEVLKGRFIVYTENNLICPMLLIMESNVICGFGKTSYRNRKFFNALWGYTKAEFVEEATARIYIRKLYASLLQNGQVSNCYRGFPKTVRGFEQGFFRKRISQEKFKQYKDQPYFFEQNVFKHLKQET